MKNQPKAKSSNTSRKEKKPLKTWHGTESDRDLFTDEEIHRTPEQILEIAREALQYCIKEPKCLKISQFIRHRRLKQSTWTYWKSKFPWFKEYNDECLLALADKREVGASFRELDKDMQLKVLHMYDPSWKGIHEFHAKLKDEQQTASAEVLKEVLQEVLKPFDKEEKK